LLKKSVSNKIFILSIIFFISLSPKAVFPQEIVVLQLILNKDSKGEYFLVIAPDNDVWIKRQEFEKLGLKTGLGGDVQFADETYVSLRSISGLEFNVNEEQVSLDITAAPTLFKEQGFDIFYKKPYNARFLKDPSGFLNYSLYYDHKSEVPLFGVYGELGISVSDYFGKSTFAYDKTGEEEKIVRLMTNLTVNNRDNLRTIIVGDVPASSGASGPGTILGGINISKDFSMDPYFLRFPALNLSGTLETPSDIEVYSDDALVRKERLSPGNFSFNDVPATVGLGNARIIIKDVYGRESTISTPYYYTNRLLKKGLHEYSYSLGFIRKDLGVTSFTYGDPAFLSFHNYGISDQLKIGYAAEASKGLINLGPAATILIPNAGVLDALFSVSNSAGKAGFSGFLGYSFQSKKINANVSLLYNSKEYSNISVKPSDEKARYAFSNAIGFGGEKTGFITMEWSGAEMYLKGKVSRTAVSYNKALTKQTTLFINATEIKDTETNDEVLAGIHMYLGKDILGHVSYTGGKDSEVKKIGVQKSLPAGNGYGFKADVEFKDSVYTDNKLQYQGASGIYQLDLSNRIRNDGYSASVSGGIGYIDRSIFFSKPINDSFAKVKVDDLEGVRVYYYGNEAGRTNEKGDVIITGLRSFNDNRIDIESRDIPINYSIDSMTQYISPLFRSGSIVTFDVNRMQGIVGTVHILEDGKELPAEYKIIFVQVNDRILEGSIGRDGEFYLENIPRGRHAAKIIQKGKDCIFDIIIPDSEEMLVDVGKITCETDK
jgi:outer membrane usher protein